MTTMDAKKRTTALDSLPALLGACAVMVTGIVMLIAMGFHADAVGGSLETWEVVTPWAVFAVGSLLTLWVLSARARNGQTWALAAAILLAVPTLVGLVALGTALFAP